MEHDDDGNRIESNQINLCSMEQSHNICSYGYDIYSLELENEAEK